MQPFHLSVWVVMWVAIGVVYSLHVLMARLHSRVVRRLLITYTLLFFGVFLQWFVPQSFILSSPIHSHERLVARYPSILAVELVMEKPLPPPFRDAAELAQDIIDGKRRFVYQVRSFVSPLFMLMSRG